MLLALLRVAVLRRCRIGARLGRLKAVTRACCAIVLSVALLASPICLTHSIQMIDMNATATSLTGATYTIRLSEWGKWEHQILLKISLWVIGLLFKLLPCIFLSVFIGVLLYAYRTAQRHRQTLVKAGVLGSRAIVSHYSPSAPSHKRRHSTSMGNTSWYRRRNGQPQGPFKSQTTTLLALILLIFLLTELPQATMAMLCALFPERIYAGTYQRFANLLDLLSLLNSSVNLVVYCALSSTFRTTFRLVFIERLSKMVTAANSDRSEVLHENLSTVAKMAAFPLRRQYVNQVSKRARTYDGRASSENLTRTRRTFI